MLLFRTISKSFFLKILALTALLSFVPFVVLGFYSIVQVNSLSDNITQAQIQSAIKNALDQKFVLLEKEAELINTDFRKVEQNLKLIQRQAEHLFAQSDAYVPPLPVNLVKSPKGYLWEPFADKNEKANLFVSARATTSLSNKELSQAKQLEPLLKQSIENEPILKAVFFCLSESGWIIYPAMDADYEVAINKLPPDIRVQDYPFYYLADQEHNPNRTVKWTSPYNDVTHWEMVVTAVVPVHLPTGQLRGVVGADFPITFINEQVLNFTRTEPNAFAFIRDTEGHFIAGEKNELYAKLFGDSAAKTVPHTKGIHKIATPEGNFYLLSTPIASNGWVLNYVLPELDITSPIIKDVSEQTSRQMELYVQRLLLFLLLGSISVILFSYVFSQSVTKPIKRLTKASEAMINGTHREDIPVIFHDEIGRLTRTFNYMNVMIDKLINELTDRAHQLEERVIERTWELLNANDQLKSTFERLKKSETARTELIVQISHDLKTPLTSIKGYLQLLNAYKFPDEHEKEFKELVLLRTNHMIQLIDDLFEISAMDLDESQFEQEWVPVEFMIEHALEIATSKATDADLQIHTEFSCDLPLVYVDPKKMNRALINILSNAIKYSKESEERQINIKAYLDETRVVMEIADNGMGIAEENLEKIFSFFYRELQVQAANIGGSGLGLGIAKKIIDKHQGDIRIYSKLGQGTTVVISLPYVEMD